MEMDFVINNPCDETDYYMGYPVGKNVIYICSEVDVTIKQYGGSFEKIKWYVKDGLLVVSTPCFVKNPNKIKIKVTI